MSGDALHPPTLRGIHHVKLPVSELARSVAFYRAVFGAERLADADPVDRAALAAWSAHLDALGVDHSPVVTAMRAWLVVLADPDGTRLRLYTLEQHGPEVPPAEDDPWIVRA